MSLFYSKLLIEIEKPDSIECLLNYMSDGRIENGKSIEPETGRFFEAFRRDENLPNQITAYDLLAVTFLSIRIANSGGIRPKSVEKLFDSEIQKLLRAELRHIPSSWCLESITEDEFEVVEMRSSNLFKILDEEVGLGRVSKYKLLARKRPSLYPIRDSVVEKLLGPKTELWYRNWFDSLRQDDAKVTKILRKIRNLDGFGGQISAEVKTRVENLGLIRVADIVIWERNHLRTPKKSKKVLPT